MPTIFARGVAKTVAINPETTFGVQGAGNGQLLRRTSSDLNLTVQQIQSNEILQSQQVRDSRNGPRQVQGTLSGQLSPASYSTLLENMLRSTYTSSAPIVGLADSTAVVDPTTGNLILSSSSANFSSHFTLGDVVQISGLTGPAAADNYQDCRVVGYTPTGLALAPPSSAIAWGTGQVETIGLTGKKLFMPATGQSDKSFSLEHWYSDIGQSELFVGCKVTQLSLNIPASGFVTLQASVTGRDMISTAVQALPLAAPQTITTGLTATSGKISYNGATIAYLTAMSVQISSSVQADPVVGANVVPAIFLGTLMVRGSVSALTAADTLTTDFINENEVSLSVLMTSSPSGSASFVNVFLPRVKLTSSTKTDSDKAITRSFNFVALENTGTLGGNLTSIVIQDSLTP